MLSGKDVVKYLVDHLLQEQYLSIRENSDVTYKCLQTPATCSYQIYVDKRDIYATDTPVSCCPPPCASIRIKKRPKQNPCLNLLQKSRSEGDFLELLLYPSNNPSIWLLHRCTHCLPSRPAGPKQAATKLTQERTGSLQTRGGWVQLYSWSKDEVGTGLQENYVGS